MPMPTGEEIATIDGGISYGIIAMGISGAFNASS